TSPKSLPDLKDLPQGYVGAPASGGVIHTEHGIEYEVNTTETRREIPPGAIRRLSVAVLIDGDLTDAQEASISTMLISALGLDPGRGDQVHVDSMPFARRSSTEVDPGSGGVGAWLSRLDSWGPWAFGMLALLGLV